MPQILPETCFALLASMRRLGCEAQIEALLGNEKDAFARWRNAVDAEHDRINKMHAVVQVTRHQTKKGDPMWECLTDEGIKFFLFDPFGIANLDMYVELKRMDLSQVLYWDDYPIRVRLTEIGGWLKPIECKARAPEAVPNERHLPFNVRWVRELFKRPFVVIDLETTGTHETAEIIQIGIAFSSGQFAPMRINIRPQHPVPDEATRVHGIKTSDLQGEKSFAEVLPKLQNILNGMHVVAYNAEFEQARLAFELARINAPDALSTSIQCAMKAYAYGRPYPKLVDACHAMGVPFDGAHDAMADAQATLALLQAMKQKIDALEVQS